MEMKREKKKIKERTSTRDGDGSAAGLFVSYGNFFYRATEIFLLTTACQLWHVEVVQYMCFDC